MNAIIIDEFFPDVSRDSGSIDIINYIEALKSLKYGVTLLTTVSNQDNRGSSFDNEKGFDWVPASKMEEWLIVHGKAVTVVFVCRPGPASGWIHKLRSLAPYAALIYLTVDLHFLRLEREFTVLGGHEKLAEARRYRNVELASIRQADLSVVVSSHERNYLYSIDPSLRVDYTPLFRNRIGSSVSYVQRYKRAVFIGGYQHLPNIDAAYFLVEHIVPHIRNVDPEIEIVLAGSNMPENVRNLERPGVRAVGQIDNLAEFFDSARVSVAPLRFGAGQKGKVLSSLCHRLPVVCSSIAAEGFFEGATQGILIADDPMELAANIVLMCNSATDWSQLAEQADNLSLQRDTSQLPSVLNEMISRAQRNKPGNSHAHNGLSEEPALSVLLFTRDGSTADPTVIQSWISQVESSRATELLILNAGKAVFAKGATQKVKEVLGLQGSVDRFREGLRLARGRCVRFASDDDAILSNIVSELEAQIMSHQGPENITLIGDFILKSAHGLSVCEQSYQNYPRGSESYQVFVNSLGAIPAYYSIFPMPLVKRWQSYLSEHFVPFSYTDWLLTTLAFSRSCVRYPGAGKMISYYDHSNWSDQTKSELQNLEIMRYNGVPESMLPMINLFWLIDALLLIDKTHSSESLELKADISEQVKKDQLKRFVDNLDFRLKLVGRHTDVSYIHQIGRLSPFLGEGKFDLQSFRNLVGDVVTGIEGCIPTCLEHYFEDS